MALVNVLVNEFVLLNFPTLIGFLTALILGLVLGWFFARRSRRRNITTTNNELTQEPGELSPQLLDATLNEMREGLLVIDHEMRVVTANRAARDLLLGGEPLTSSRRLTELTRNPAIYDAFLDAVRGIERSGVKVETFGVASRRVFDLRVVPLRGTSAESIAGALGVFFDVTQLERLETIRQEFLSNVSHELRTPLTSIMALAETLEAGALSDPENNSRFVSIIKKNATRMHRLIDDILELSAIEAGNVRVSPESVPLRPMVEDVVGSLAAAGRSPEVTISNNVPSKAMVYADPHRLAQMLTNLIDNAVKFNRQGGSVTVRYECNDRDRIIVEDTGEGIPTHHLDRLFERFYRVDRARSRELGGTGLGLAIVKHLAKAHRGEVQVRSKVGEGSVFTVELPRNSRSDPDELPPTRDAAD